MSNWDDFKHGFAETFCDVGRGVREICRFREWYWDTIGMVVAVLLLGTVVTLCFVGVATVIFS